MLPTNPYLQSWRPPFCPNPNCKHHNQIDQPWPYKKIGFYRRLASPHRIQRFTCLCCRRSFSRQTFSTSYWLKRPDLPTRIFMKIVGGMAARQIARDLRVAPSTVDRIVSRLGRHCLLFHRTLTEGYLPRGDIVIDGFESFETSQYYPFALHLSVAVQTSFFIHFTDSELRRKGRMRPAQKRRRAELERRYGRPDPRAVEKDVTELLEVTLSGLEEAVVRSDDHHGYRRSIGRIRGCRIRHQVTSSRERRDQGNPLWEVNLLDLLIRHSQANHRRETLAWSKRRQGSAERLAVLLVWRNYIKRRWEKGDEKTPGMLVGLTERPLTAAEVLTGRLFRTRVELPPRWSMYYDGAVETRVQAVNRRHELKYAY
jgi:transposase-like protein